MGNNALETLKQDEKSISFLISQYKDKMIKRSSDTIRKADPAKQDQFISRMISTIIKDDNLKECFQTIPGKVSIYTLMDDCLRTGLQLGKHVYAIPFSRKYKDGWVKEAKFMVKKEGYHAMLCGGNKPIFKDLKHGIVYEKEKDNIKINRATGEIDHPACIESDPGKPVGCWVQAKKLDGSLEAEFYPIRLIYNIRDHHSKSYQDFKEKKIKSSPWVTDEEAMIEKTAIKKFCKPYAEVCEELSNAYYSESDDIEEGFKEAFNLEEVANSKIDEAINKLDPENTIESDEIIEEEVIEEKKEDKKILF